MRVALLSDIHGNALALEAVLADIDSHGGADAYWVLGDLVALGPEPVRTLEILTSLPHARFIRGNTDRYVYAGDRPPPNVEDAQRNPQLLTALVEVANTFAWTQGMITSSGWLEWLRALPLELRVTLPDGTPFLGVHASPGQDDGPGIDPRQKTIAAADADLLCVGHTHLPFDTMIGGIRVVNPGAVSLSLTGDKAACYGLLNVSSDGYSIALHQVHYDRDAVIEQLKHLGHPGREYLIRHLR
jgi:predicted phosphodiesterase